MNQGGGHGLEAPCIHHLYGPEAYLRHLKELVDVAGVAAGHVLI